MKIKTVIRFKFIRGLKQDPPDTDFHITPCLTFGNQKIDNVGKVWGLGLEWGYWAVVFGVYAVIIRKEIN